MTKEIKHGTRNAYVNGGCRCAECKAAEAEYQRRRAATKPCVTCGRRSVTR